MRSNFLPSLQHVLQSEGGYVNDPLDPGGATNRGITQTVYDNWRRSQGLSPRNVISIGDGEVSAIYRKLYWDAVSGDSLPSGLDYAVFDFAVNSGPARAARFLQRVVGAVDDGKIGPATIAAVHARDPKAVIAALSAMRQDFLEGLSTFPHFGGGWTARVASVKARATEMVA